MKIFVIWWPGSGKSYISKKLWKHLWYDVLDLDDIFWDKSKWVYGYRKNDNIRDSEFQDFMNQKNRIIEWAYWWWEYGERVKVWFEQADIIFVLRINKFVKLWRVIKRSLLRKIGIQKQDMKETLIWVYEIIKRAYNFDYKMLPKILANIPSNKKTIEITKYNLKLQDILNKIR